VLRDEAVHQMVVLRDELEIFGLAKGDRRRDAVLPNLFLKTREIPKAQQRQDAVQQERLAGRVRQAEVERPDAAPMAQLQVLPGPEGQPPQELLRVSQQRVPEKVLE
jgi:hypothetical protein